MKDAFWFKLETSLFRSHELMMMRHIYGLEGVALFMMLLCYLREQEKYRVKVSEKFGYGLIAGAIGVDPAKFDSWAEDCINEFELLVFKDGFLSSPYLTEVMKRWDANKRNGSKGGRPKKPKPNPDETQSKPKPNPDETIERRGEERIEEEIESTEEETPPDKPPVESVEYSVEDFIKDYPKNTSRQTVEKAWRDLLSYCEPERAATIRKLLKVQTPVFAKFIKESERPYTKIPEANNWLKNGGWDRDWNEDLKQYREEQRKKEQPKTGGFDLSKYNGRG